MHRDPHCLFACLVFISYIHQCGLSFLFSLLLCLLICVVLKVSCFYLLFLCRLLILLLFFMYSDLNITTLIVFSSHC